MRRVLVVSTPGTNLEYLRTMLDNVPEVEFVDLARLAEVDDGTCIYIAPLDNEGRGLYNRIGTDFIWIVNEVPGDDETVDPPFIVSYDVSEELALKREIRRLRR